MIIDAYAISLHFALQVVYSAGSIIDISISLLCCNSILKCYSISFLGEWCSGSGHGNSKKQAMLIKKVFALFSIFSHNLVPIGFNIV